MARRDRLVQRHVGVAAAIPESGMNEFRTNTAYSGSIAPARLLTCRNPEWGNEFRRVIVLDQCRGPRKPVFNRLERTDKAGARGVCAARQFRLRRKIAFNGIAESSWMTQGPNPRAGLALSLNFFYTTGKRRFSWVPPTKF
jgi:hypothetical protein